MGNKYTISVLNRDVIGNNSRVPLDPLLWSYPIRLVTGGVASNSRVNVSILYRSCECNNSCVCGYHSVCAVLSIVVSSYGVVYLTIEEDAHAYFLIHNNSRQLIYLGQTVMSEANEKTGELCMTKKNRNDNLWHCINI